MIKFYYLNDEWILQESQFSNVFNFLCQLGKYKDNISIFQQDENLKIKNILPLNIQLYKNLFYTFVNLL